MVNQILTLDADIDNTTQNYRQSALMTAAYILICLTKGKSHEEIARDFDYNVELVSVWIDYMVGIKWIYKNIEDKWIATDNGKRWIEKYYNIRDD